MSNKGDRLVAALEANPDLLFEVVGRLRGAKVAGPWTPARNNQYKRLRRSMEGRIIAVVTKHATRKINPWAGSVQKVEGSEVRPEENHPQQSLAMDWCDAQLVLQGYILAGWIHE